MSDFDQLAYIRSRAPGCECEQPCVTYRIQAPDEKWHHYPWSYGHRVGLYDGISGGTRWSNRDAAILAYAHKHNMTEAQVEDLCAQGAVYIAQSNAPCGWSVVAR